MDFVKDAKLSTEGLHGEPKGVYSFTLGGESYSVQVLERWKHADNPNGRLQKVDYVTGNPVVLGQPEEKDGTKLPEDYFMLDEFKSDLDPNLKPKLEHDWGGQFRAKRGYDEEGRLRVEFLYDLWGKLTVRNQFDADGKRESWFEFDEKGDLKSGSPILRKAAPPSLLLVTKLEDGSSLAIKAVLGKYAGDATTEKRERDLLLRYYPDSKEKIPTRAPIRFEHRGMTYVGYAQERVQGISLKDAVKAIQASKCSASWKVRRILALYREVLAEYQRIERIPYDVSYGNIFVLTDKQKNIHWGYNNEKPRVQMIDLLDGMNEFGQVIGNKRRHTYGSVDRKMFDGNDRAYATFSCFYAIHKMLRDDLAWVGCPQDVLDLMGKRFKTDAVVDTAKGRKQSDAMFAFYNELLAEMREKVAPDAGKVVRATEVPFEKNPVVVRLNRNLSKLCRSVNHMLAVAEEKGEMENFDGLLQDYRKLCVQDEVTKKWTMKPLESPSAALDAIQSANSVVAEAKRLSADGQFKHRVLSRYRKGGDLAFSTNRGAIAAVVLAILFGGVIPGLIALMVLTKLEAQQTKRELQVGDMAATWKKSSSTPKVGLLAERNKPDLDQVSRLDVGDRSRSRSDFSR